MRRLEVPVLVVGAGPSGLMASLLLEQQGVETLVVERRPHPQRAPAAHVVNPRTFEICRSAGVDMQRLAQASSDPADAGWVYFALELGGRELGRLRFEEQGDDQLDVTPTPLRNLSQNRFEPALLAALEARANGRTPRWSSVWESAEQTGEGVVSRVRDLASDELLEIRSRHLVAADGAGSRVRKWLGIGVSGPDRIRSFVMIHLRASLRERAGDPPGVLFFLFGPATGGGVFVVHDLDGEAVYMSPFDPDTEDLESYDAERCAALVRAGLADPDLDFEVETVGSWTMTAQVADAYREGDVYLVGDAAHRFPPTGGLGLNTGVQDAHNLAWKLAAVERGWAGRALLDSYESERHPVARHNADQSLRNALKLMDVPRALGVLDGDDPDAALRTTLGDAEAMARVEAAVADQAEHFDLMGLHLGFAYERGAVIHDGAPVPGTSDPRRYTPCGAPGHRLPHAWMEDGTTSLLDLVPLGRLLLLAGPDAKPWLDAAISLADERLAARQLTAAELPGLSGWLASAGIGPQGALLVRPDQHVGWRAPDAQPDPARALAHALDTLLARRAVA